MNNLKSFLINLDYYFEKALYYLAGILLLILASSIFYSVMMRYVFSEPPLWSDEAPRAFFLWVTYIGIIATKQGKNIRVTHFIDKVPITKSHT